MGSKNRIFLGFITAQILHNCRNIFNENKLVISKKKLAKIKIDHPCEAKYIAAFRFEELLGNTIASCTYKENGIYNFIVCIEERYLIYGISVNNFHNELATVFQPSIRQLIKCQRSINFFSKVAQAEFERYIKN